ncbi:MAG TPA: RlmE family RNA methyltransferase [Nitrososphaeraceae archaeon]
MKLSDARKDHYRKLAKDKGYRSRSAYKLLQLNNSYHIFRQRNKVIDLGCAPGGWLQVAIKEVGSCGKVIGIDLKEVKPLEGAIILHGNIEDHGIIDGVIKILNSKADVVLSDLSPNVSGIWDIDHARQISLTKSAFSVAQKILKENGNAIFKVFEGDLLNEVKDDLNSNFHKVLLTKPGASRQQSSELYIVCLKFRG